ncbi:MAG: DUF262 domain-containing protein [SAR324 cluster bacterium]|nr:DUF262 domain-containing protein [SAR324 cluster bacterium]
MSEQDFKNPVTPKLIEEKKLKFRIPLYQRPYSWEDKQVEQLLCDLYNQFKKNYNENYYVGILSVAKTQDDPFRYDLIDGQQRITTLTLVGKAASAFYSEEWKAFFAEKRLELYGRIAEQAFLGFDENKDTLHLNKETGESAKKMQKAVEITRKYFKEQAKTKQEEFSRFIYEKTSFFISEVPSTYTILDKNQQFVRMNNRGRQLENHEILKVRLSAKINEPGQSKLLKNWNNMLAHLTGKGEDLNRVKTLKEILNPVSEQTEPTKSFSGKDQYYMPLTTVPEFLLIALARFKKSNGEEEYQGNPFDTEKLLEIFSELEKSEDIVKFADTINEQVEILKSFFIYIGREGNKLEYKFWRNNNSEDKDTEDVYSSKFNDTGKNWKQRLKAIQSFLHVSTEPHHWLVPAFNWCKSHPKNGDGKINAEEFVTKIEEIDNILITNTRKLTSLEELKNMVYGEISHYWFYRLDYELWKRYKDPGNNSIWENLSGKNNVKDLLNKFCFRRCASIEHIEPRNPMEKPNEIKEIDSFGNLALISGSRNSKFSNNSPDGKKQLILDSEYSESIKMAHFLWCGNGTIEEKGEAMRTILYDTVKNYLYQDSSIK